MTGALSHRQSGDLRVESVGVESGPLIAAITDYDAALSWTDTFVKENSKKAAQKESERLMEWLDDKEISLRGVNFDLAREYINFLANPYPPEKWIGKKSKKYLKDGSRNPRWRPFTGPLSNESIRLSLSMVRAFYDFLVAARWTDQNPFALIKNRQVKKRGSRKILKRTLRRSSREALREYFNALPSLTSQKDAIRKQWILYFIFLTAFRLSEAANALMKDFHRDDNGSWWITVVGKGDIESDVPVPKELLGLLRSYRESIGLEGLPVFNEDIPVIGSEKDHRKALRPNSLWLSIKNISRGAAVFAKNNGYEDQVIDELERMSTHWLRHTSASVQVNELKLSLPEVRDNLRHGNISVTSLYVASEDQERNNKTSKLSF